MDLFRPLLNLFQARVYHSITVDSFASTLHYKFSTGILLVCSVLVTAKQFFGEPIHCIVKDDFDTEAINSYCWIYGTYSVKSNFDVSKEMKPAYPGLGQLQNDKEREYHFYYQWVFFVLILQAAMFYVPHFLWKVWEGGLARKLTHDLMDKSIIEKWEQRKTEFVESVCENNVFKFQLYGYAFLLCECLNLVNVLSQLFILDKFLGGQFTSYGSAIAAFNRNPNGNVTNPMDRLFPKVTKCEFKSYGPGGSVQVSDYLCILPLNNINEKLFVFIWFWLVILICISALAILYRVGICNCSLAREFLLKRQAGRISRKGVAVIVEKLSFGQWHLLYQIGRNITPAVFNEILGEMEKILTDDKYVS